VGDEGLVVGDPQAQARVERGVVVGRQAAGAGTPRRGCAQAGLHVRGIEVARETGQCARRVLSHVPGQRGALEARDPREHRAVSGCCAADERVEDRASLSGGQAGEPALQQRDARARLTGGDHAEACGEPALPRGREPASGCEERCALSLRHARKAA
jgi:hypothetical protein